MDYILLRGKARETYQVLSPWMHTFLHVYMRFLVDWVFNFTISDSFALGYDHKATGNGE